MVLKRYGKIKKPKDLPENHFPDGTIIKRILPEPLINKPPFKTIKKVIFH